jgi:hypothetical protein
LTIRIHKHIGTEYRIFFFLEHAKHYCDKIPQSGEIHSICFIGKLNIGKLNITKRSSYVSAPVRDNAAKATIENL